MGRRAAGDGERKGKAREDITKKEIKTEQVDGKEGQKGGRKDEKKGGRRNSSYLLYTCTVLFGRSSTHE